MKILLINKFHYIKGGSERVYFDTKKLLEKNGHEVVCFSMKDERNEPCAQEKYFVDHVDFTSSKNWLEKSLRYLYYPQAAKNLEKLILDEKPDIAHLHNISHQLTPSILKPLKKHKIPVVQTLHDYQLICPNYRLFTKGKVCQRCKKHKYFNCVLNRCVQDSFLASKLAAMELFFQWIFKFYKEKVDMFISPSNFLKETLLQWGIKQPIKVVNNALDLAEFKPRYEFGDYIVCFGRLSREKGVLTLIKAVGKLSDVKLKVVGNGPQKDDIRKYLKDEKIKNVEMAGPRYGEDLFKLIKNARFVVVPSSWYENYPMSVLEAMALGKPVLATKLGGLAEMIVENHNGWFFQADNVKELRLKIKKHYLETDKLVELGKNARQSVEHQNCSSKYYEELMRCYEKVSSGKVISLG